MIMKKIDCWLIVGTRRWARLIASELCKVVSEEVIIHMQGDVYDTELRRWLEISGLEKRIEIVETARTCSASMTGVALIVNSAYRHRLSIEEVLSAGYNVVTEKPITFSQEETISLLERVKAHGRLLFCTNTYLFASYLDRLRNDVLKDYKVTAIHISWLDSVDELRYGETKSYDSSVPVIFDVLPHVANIILATIGECSPIPVGISVRRGGSEVSIRYKHEDIDIHVHIARNAVHRKRTVKFYGNIPKVVIDFTSEPGKLFVGASQAMSADPSWNENKRPIAAMLSSVIEFFESGEKDERLSPYAGLFGNKLIDAVAGDYVDQQINFLSKIARSDIRSSDNDAIYALKEYRSITERVLPYIASTSPLKQFASATCDLG